ncbi:hypothetical protein HAX54_002390 [Datura stramonium]|uniref:Uncharacterized protein n=1 Tax=Datura stramonium TaxID=4076 RepID=A0ABS8WTZ0_DATST|nr:hypothetical protein [Datura stramonium]
MVVALQLVTFIPRLPSLRPAPTTKHTTSPPSHRNTTQQHLSPSPALPYFVSRPLSPSPPSPPSQRPHATSSPLTAGHGSNNNHATGATQFLHRKSPSPSPGEQHWPPTSINAEHHHHTPLTPAKP